MRRALLLLALSAPLHASAQMAQPITLTAEEYTRLVSTLAERDPLIAMLLQKQREAAQRAALSPSVPAPANPSGASAPNTE